MIATTRRTLLPFGIVVCIAAAVTGCNSPLGKLSPLNRLSSGSHGFTCCGTESCSHASPAPQRQPEVTSRHGSGTTPDATHHNSGQTSNPISSMFMTNRSTNLKRGLFSCGEVTRQTTQIRSQNHAAEPRQFPGEESAGVARVSPSTSNAVTTYHALNPLPGLPIPEFDLADGPIRQASAVSFSYSEPRVAISETGQAVYEPDDSRLLGKPHEQFPDEYLLDGGDRDHPVHYQGQYRDGLETEDTIGEYLDHTGKPHTKATNQVAIYSPRFASVRAVTTPSGDTAIRRLAGMHETTRDSGVSSRVGPLRHTESLRLSGIRVRSRASGINTREGQSGTINVAALNSHTKLLNISEDFSYFLRGEIQQSDEARLAAGIEAAVAWTRDQNPVLMAQLDSLHEVTVKFRLAEMVGVEDPRKDPGRLEIVKVANRSTAKPGDIVTFAIRYENKGEREVTDVRIVDNLTPRLEYIEDSATSDRDGDITVQDNEEGSLVLTFKLDAPLKEKTSGVVTFQCRVR